MNPNDFLFPNELAITKNMLQSILFIGSCNASDFSKKIQQLFPEKNIGYIYYGIGTKMPEIDINDKFQLQYIQIPLREIIGDAIISIGTDNPLDYTTVLSEFGILSVVSNFIVPQSINAPSLGGMGSKQDLSWVVSELNKVIPSILNNYKNVYLGDAESIAASFGKRHFLDDFFYFSTHGTIASSTHGTVADGEDWSFGDNFPQWAGGVSGRIEQVPNVIDYYELKGEDFYKLVYSQLNWIFRVVNQTDSVKLVIFDLDNTLWRGQIGEHYDDGRAWPDMHGWPVGIWETVQILRRRGILVSISSKNDMATVRSRWGRAVPLNWIKFDDFVSPRINWHSKAENIQELLSDLSLTAKSVLLVDDNPIERAEVSTLIPGIRTIGSNPYTTRRILLWSSETNRPLITDESLSREKSYHGLIARNELKKQYSRDEFLINMQVFVEIEIIKSTVSDDFQRILELINKTNQFNTTGLKWTNESLGNAISEGASLYVAKVKDKFSNYGLTAVAIVQRGVIKQFVMSCRVLGLDVDKALIALISRLNVQGGASLIGAVIKSDLNNPCLNTYTDAGFQKTDMDGVYITNYIIEPPTTISVNYLN
jgi:FkbH-like protein